jgi:hypothetical protein
VDAHDVSANGAAEVVRIGEESGLGGWHRLPVVRGNAESDPDSGDGEGRGAIAGSEGRHRQKRQKDERRDDLDGLVLAHVRGEDSQRKPEGGGGERGSTEAKTLDRLLGRDARLHFDLKTRVQQKATATASWDRPGIVLGSSWDRPGSFLKYPVELKGTT